MPCGFSTAMGSIGKTQILMRNREGVAKLLTAARFGIRNTLSDTRACAWAHILQHPLTFMPEFDF